MLNISRIRHTDEVLAVIKRGGKIRTPYFLLHALPSKEWRMACVVGKKVSKSAVIRHRVQRRLRESVKSSILESSASSYDVVVVALPAILKVDSYKTLRQAVLLTISKLQ